MPDLNSALSTALIDRYKLNAARIRELAAPLANEKFWQKPYPYGNSFGHLVLHLTGNLSYYVGAQIAQTGYIRDRPHEFNDPNPPSKDEALRRFDAAVAMVVKTIQEQSSDDWSAPYTATGAHAKNRLDMVIQCAAHMQHHIGQMIYLGHEWKRQST
jgi:DinB superfamily